jgi:hypothetical protein
MNVHAACNVTTELDVRVARRPQHGAAPDWPARDHHAHVAVAGPLRRRALRQHRRAAAHARGVRRLHQWVLDLGLAEEYPRSSCWSWAQRESPGSVAHRPDEEVTAIFAAGRDAIG